MNIQIQVSKENIYMKKQAEKLAVQNDCRFTSIVSKAVQSPHKWFHWCLTRGDRKVAFCRWICKLVLLQVSWLWQSAFISANLRKQETTSLLVGTGPVKSHHPFICLKDKLEEWKMKRGGKDPLWNWGVNLAAEAQLISGFRMQSRPMEQKRARASEMDEQQYEINPMPVFVNSASNDTVIHVEAKRRQITSLPLAL